MATRNTYKGKGRIRKDNTSTNTDRVTGKCPCGQCWCSVQSAYASLVLPGCRQVQDAPALAGDHPPFGDVQEQAGAQQERVSAVSPRDCCVHSSLARLVGPARNAHVRQRRAMRRQRFSLRRVTAHTPPPIPTRLITAERRLSRPISRRKTCRWPELCRIAAGLATHVSSSRRRSRRFATKSTRRERIPIRCSCVPVKCRLDW